MLNVRSPGRKKKGSPESGHLKIPGQPEPDVMSGWALVHLQERGGKAKGRMVTHFQSHLFSFTISFFLSLSLSFNAQIKSQKIDPMPKIGLLDRSRERSADPNIKYYMAGLFLDWLKSYFQRRSRLHLIILLESILCSKHKIRVNKTFHQTWIFYDSMTFTFTKGLP